MLAKKYLDEDGYPTKDALDAIINFSYEKDYNDLFKFIESLWHLKWFGWNAEDPKVETYTSYDGVLCERTSTEYFLSTAGWSGNESLIKAMQANSMFWSDCWVSSRRGGHYEFIVENIKDLK